MANWGKRGGTWVDGAILIHFSRLDRVHAFQSAFWSNACLSKCLRATGAGVLKLNTNIGALSHPFVTDMLMWVSSLITCP